MAIVNRDLDVTQQIVTYQEGNLSTTVGASATNSYLIAQAPYPCTLRSVNFSANAISGAPVISVSIKRFTAGGVTTIPYVGSTLAVTAFGLSAAYQSVSLAASGSTLLMLQTGDGVLLVQEFSGGNVATSSAVASVSLQATQDYTEHFGINS